MLSLTKTPVDSAKESALDPDPVPASSSVARKTHGIRKLVGLAGQHPGLLILLAAGALLRVLVGIAYGSAFYFSDTEGYFTYAELGYPAQIRPYGYSAVLNLFEWTRSVWPLIIFQHLVGLGCAVLVYALVRRKGGAAWLALLAAAPIAFDAYELVVEHYLLGDTLFTAMLVGAFVALMWQDRLTMGPAILGGLLLAAAVLTRTIGTPLVIVVGLYVIIRRVGWRPFLAFCAACAIPLVGYLGWFHHYYGKYTFSTWQDRWMYGRVMSIADCERLKLDATEQPLCRRPNAAYAYDVDFYVWSQNSPVVKVKRKYVYFFSAKVISQQPVDYAALVTKETWAYFSPNFYVNREQPRGTTCPGIWEFPSQHPDAGSCTPRPVSTSAFGDHKGDYPTRWHSPLTGFFHGYSTYGITPGPLLLLCLLLVLAAVVVPIVRGPRDGRWRLRWDAMVLGASGLALLAGAVATSQFDIRYGIPVLAIIPAAGALAWVSLRSTLARSSSTEPIAEPNRA